MNVDWLAASESTPRLYLHRRKPSETWRPGRTLCVRAHPSALALGLVVSTCLAYAGVGHHQFLNFDDPSYVTGNPNVLGGLSWDGVIWAFTAGAFGELASADLDLAHGGRFRVRARLPDATTL